MAGEFQVAGKHKAALFTPKLHRKPGETTWWAQDYAIARKIRDRELFA